MARKSYAQKPTCPGSGQAPRALIQNDWWVGVKGLCPQCFRSVNVKNEKIARHRGQTQVAAPEKA